MTKRLLILIFSILLTQAIDVRVGKPEPNYDWQIFEVTGYCNCDKCINVKKWRDGRFASNRKTYFGGIAADKSIPFGTDIEFSYEINGLKVFTVEDRGSAIKGNRLDIWFPTHKQAKAFGHRQMFGRIK